MRRNRRGLRNRKPAQLPPMGAVSRPVDVTESWVTKGKSETEAPGARMRTLEVPKEDQRDIAGGSSMRTCAKRRQ